MERKRRNNNGKIGEATRVENTQIFDREFLSSFQSIFIVSLFQPSKMLTDKIINLKSRGVSNLLIIDILPDENSKVVLTGMEKQIIISLLPDCHYYEISLKEWKNFASAIRNNNQLRQRMILSKGIKWDKIDTSPSESIINSLNDPAHLKHCHELLGFLFMVKGTVVYGNQIGRTLGFPTVNIEPESDKKIIPPHGVYAGWAKYRNRWFKAMVNIGIRPTLNMKNVTMEAHIFDFSDEIYGETVSLHFYERIRNEMRFSSLHHLKMQLDVDKQQTLKILKDSNLENQLRQEELIIYSK